MPASKTNSRNIDKLSCEEKEEILKAYYDGMSKKDITKNFNLTVRTYSALMKESSINAKRKNKYVLNEEYFDNIDTQRKAYWLGFIAADGCITETNYFAFSLKDKDILYDFKNDIDYTGEIKTVINKYGTYYRINFSSKLFCDNLRKIGISERKSLIYNDLPDIRPNLMRHFVRGYFDGDGCIYWGYSISYNPKKISKVKNWGLCIIATKQLCLKFQDLFSTELKYIPHINKSPSESMFYVSIYKNSALIDFYKYMYNESEVCLERKRKKYDEFMGSLKQKYLKEKCGEPL